jgi:hypothetical protein
MGRYAPSNMHAVLWDEAVMAPLPRQRVSAMDKRAFSMFNASPHCVWEPMKRLGAAGEWWGGLWDAWFETVFGCFILAAQAC